MLVSETYDMKMCAVHVHSGHFDKLVRKTALQYFYGDRGIILHCIQIHEEFIKCRFNSYPVFLFEPHHAKMYLRAFSTR